MAKAKLTSGIHYSFSWTSKIGFVYVPGSKTKIRAAGLNELQDAYNRGEIKAEERIGNTIVKEWDEAGRALEVPISAQTIRKKRQRSEDGQGEKLPERSVCDLKMIGERKIPNPKMYGRLKLPRLS